MKIKSTVAKVLARLNEKKMAKWRDNPIQAQENVLAKLIAQGKNTQFGRDHKFESIHKHLDFKNAVPVRSYEDYSDYLPDLIAGKNDVFWPGKPLYFAKTSGTTSGAKYIPLTKESLKYQIGAAKMALLNYIFETGKADYVDGKMIFLQGSPLLNKNSAIPTGRLSGIVANFVPGYLQSNRLPSFETNCIEDWESKVDAIVNETSQKDLRLISGIPSWVQMYFEKLQEEHDGKNIKEIFPNFNLFVYGGVNYKPYKEKFTQLIGKDVDSIELFPASEGFFAFQDNQSDLGMLLLVDSGIFYEFIPVEECHNENPTRLTLKDVELNKDYALIISTNAGLWAYNIGDLVRFTSLKPYKIVVSGRIKHFTSAFGEHVIAYEVEKALNVGIESCGGSIREFHVAPEVNPTNGLPYHEWLIEFDVLPNDLEQFTQVIDEKMQELNPYYLDLRAGNILKELVVTQISRFGFQSYMKSQGKLGGQNKVPRLSNDRKIADLLKGY